MRTPNHLAGGIVITGFCSALCGVNIFSSPWSIATMAIASLLPDIDHPKSIIGRALKPISLAINRRWGHRTITHSAVILITTSFLFALIEKNISGATTLAVIYFFAYFSHLLLDMVTLMGVPLLYPFTKNPFVMPANPRWRIRNDDRRAETIAFCLFLLLTLFMRPLFEQGFWTTYNRSFGTLKHLASEFQKAEDLLEVSYHGKIGTEPISGSGYCIEANPQYAILLENDQFRRIDKNLIVLERVTPTHTGRHFTYRRQTVIQITIDSLNHLLKNQLIAEIDLTGTQPFQALHQGITTQHHHYRQKHLTHLILIPQEKMLLPNKGSALSPRGGDAEGRGGVLSPFGGDVAKRQRGLRQTKARNHHYRQQLQLHQQRIQQLQHQIRQTPDMPTKEHLYHQLDSLRKAKLPQPDLEAEQTLAFEIALLQKQQYLKQQEQRAKELQKALESQPPPTLLSGHITFITIH